MVSRRSYKPKTAVRFGARVIWVIVVAKYREIVLTESDIARFWLYVDKTGSGPKGECWRWTAALNDSGYGMINIAKKAVRAHRISAVIAGKMTDHSLQVCHECDNPECVNPSHLFMGTRLDNMKDMVQKGRHASKTGRQNLPKGDEHWSRRCPEKVKRGDQKPLALNPSLAARGSDVGGAKLNESIVVQCRVDHANGESVRSIASRLSVTYQCVWNFINNKTWTHV